MADLPAYTPGRTVPGAIKLASNETVQGPLPSVREAILAATETINRYPDNGHIALKEQLSEHLAGDGEFGPERIAVGCGSVSLCQQLIQITCSVGDEVVFGWRSFEVYPLQVRVAGATPIQVPLRDETFDLDAMLAAITERTRLIFVCNPNNPTSTVVDPDELARFVAAVPSDILVVIDEAYVEYIRDGLVPDSLGLADNYSNVVVLRTFSKAYGLAGLRVGYLCGSQEAVDIVRRTHIAYSVNALGQIAATAALADDAGHIAATRGMVAQARSFLRDLFDGLGLEYVAGEGNFLMARTPVSDTLLYRRLMREGVMIRTMTGFRFPNWIRVSLVEEPAMAAFAKALKKVLDKP